MALWKVAGTVASGCHFLANRGNFPFIVAHWSMVSKKNLKSAKRHIYWGF
jgi:hypothetical protein